MSMFRRASSVQGGTSSVAALCSGTCGFGVGRYWTARLINESLASRRIVSLYRAARRK
jgi:hypothetical protein